MTLHVLIRTIIPNLNIIAHMCRLLLLLRKEISRKFEPCPWHPALAVFRFLSMILWTFTREIFALCCRPFLLAACSLHFSTCARPVLRSTCRSWCRLVVLFFSRPVGLSFLDLCTANCCYRFLKNLSPVLSFSLSCSSLDIACCTFVLRLFLY